MKKGVITPIDVQRYLGGINYPASKDVLVRHAKGRAADKEMINLLDRLPNREYKSPADVSHAVSDLLKQV